MPGSSIAQVDTTQLEERHRKQLLDLEEAMKSTWEAKSKVQSAGTGLWQWQWQWLYHS
jgi:hypothetical protein